MESGHLRRSKRIGSISLDGMQENIKCHPTTPCPALPAAFMFMNAILSFQSPLPVCIYRHGHSTASLQDLVSSTFIFVPSFFPLFAARLIEMERESKAKAHLMSFLLAGLVFQTVITPVVSRSLEEFSDQKNYYSTPHNPHKEPTSCSTPSNGGPSTPSHGAGGGHGLPTPSHGSGCGHGSPSPSQGGEGSYGSPPPSQGGGGGGGGGHASPPPSHGSGGSYDTPSPSRGSGGYHNAPPYSGGHSSPAIIPPSSPPMVVPPVTPSPGNGGSFGTPTPRSSGGSPPPFPVVQSPVTPPVSGGIYGTPTPSHGSGGYYNSPPTPSSGGSPAIIPSPPSPMVESPVTPPGSTGGGYGTPTPSHGSGGSYNSPPTPSSGGSPAIIPSAPSPVVESPITPPGSGGGCGAPTPSHGSGGYYNSPPTPSNDCYNSPPSSPTIEPPVTPTPTIPDITPPSPLIPDPNSHPSFTGTCNYWRTHPEAILTVLGYLGNISQLFGAACGLAFGRDLSLPEALANTRADGIGALYREGTASLLNSLADRRFPFTTQQVTDAFAAAVTSDEAAATQAELFKQANEGRLKF
ncbi:leucine-rich repeat extensin-like protein 3 isoform X2 [Phoenix dactylifera]|uniref:Leucine-rich repeat extensin-like protein 3 isoform X2 n=1 Tax=Phoenix dactylifera TaxID=42345 RepID=A0A8B9AFJ5_PHODC|nr:leucine-rich repeat extensin-like protein 3 isoform X2 [Phoenix dactylifera]